MAFRDSMQRVLVYFGLAEQRLPEVDDPDPAEPEAELEDRYRERPNVRRLPSTRRRRDEFDDIFADDDEPPGRATRVLRPVGRGGGGGGGGNGNGGNGGGGRNGGGGGGGGGGND